MKTEAQIFAEILESNQKPESIILDNGTTVKEIVIQDENHPTLGYFAWDYGRGVGLYKCEYHQNIWMQI